MKRDTVIFNRLSKAEYGTKTTTKKQENIDVLVRTPTRPTVQRATRGLQVISPRILVQEELSLTPDHW